MERFKMIASGYGFFIKKGKILLSKRQNTGYMDGYYSLPAGHIEDNEPVTKGTIREIFEEVGVELKQEDIELVHVMHRKSDDIRMDFFFRIKKWDQEPFNKEPEKCAELKWVSLKNLPKNTIPYIKKAVENFYKKIYYSEFNW